VDVTEVDWIAFAREWTAQGKTFLVFWPSCPSLINVLYLPSQKQAQQCMYHLLWRGWVEWCKKPSRQHQFQEALKTNFQSQYHIPTFLICFTNENNTSLVARGSPGFFQPEWDPSKIMSRQILYTNLLSKRILVRIHRGM
jgi:hypothetical protein